MKKERDIISAARTRMDEAVDADRENRIAALHDLEFVSGKQWPEQIKQARESANRPCPTINRLPRFVRQVTGDIRKLNPAIKVLPDGDATGDDDAKIVAGIIRQIEYVSGGSAVYEGAAESAAQCGIGNYRILTEYENDTSFNQCLKLKRIHNPLSVYWDPQAKEPTRSDAEFCFITDQMPMEAFKAEYPDKTPVDAEHDADTDGMEHWFSKGDVVVAEYFWKEPVTKKIGQLPDGSTTENMDDPAIVRTREVQTHKVMWAKISGKEVLEGPQEIPSKFIPVIAVVGEEMHIGDRVVRSSVIRYAKEPAQIYNYYAAIQTEAIALQPKAPYLVTTKQVAGLERFWKEANDANRPYLPYNPDEKAGMPQRAQPPVASSGFMQEMMRAEDDMKATTGIYDAALGGRSNEQSGVAIRQRQMESDVSTSIYTDNMAKSIEHAGRIMVDMIPRIYDTNRLIRIVGEDDQESAVEINGQATVMVEGEPLIVPVNNIAGGKFAVRVTVGPNYTTRRQETAEGMMRFMQAFPQAGQVASDLIAKAMDFPDAEKIADRLKKTLPPGVLDPEDLPPEAQQQMAQQMQMAQMQAAMEQQSQEIEMRKAGAEAVEAEADAEKAQYEAMEQQLQVAAQSGQLDALIGQIVQQQLAAILASQTGGMPFQ